MTRTSFLVASFLVSIDFLIAGERILPRVFLLNPTVISAVRESIRAGDSEYKPAVDQLRRDANKALNQQPVSVMEKGEVPVSGDKHDYMSIAPYWWPDPHRPGGKPYVRRDGEVNPERTIMKDRKNMATVISCVQTLSLGYYFTGNEAYATHASRLLRAWFLDPATRMNPNLEFAQAVIGRNNGRGAGIIETSGLRFIVDAVGLLDGSGSWTASDRREMRNWFDEYFTWLTDSKNGKEESAAKNNHGTWYDVQATSIALYLGKTALAKAIVSEAKTKRIGNQIEPDGRMPRELSRTKALGYTTMNLNGFFCLASLAEHVGVDLWSFITDDRRSIRGAVQWVVPFWTGKSEWAYKQIIQFDVKEAYPLLIQAAREFNEPRYADAARQIPGIHHDRDRTLLIYGVRTRW